MSIQDARRVIDLEERVALLEKKIDALTKLLAARNAAPKTEKQAG